MNSDPARVLRPHRDAGTEPDRRRGDQLHVVLPGDRRQSEPHFHQCENRSPIQRRGPSENGKYPNRGRSSLRSAVHRLGLNTIGPPYNVGSRWTTDCERVSVNLAGIEYPASSSRVGRAIAGGLLVHRSPPSELLVPRSKSSWLSRFEASFLGHGVGMTNSSPALGYYTTGRQSDGHVLFSSPRCSPSYVLQHGRGCRRECRGRG